MYKVWSFEKIEEKVKPTELGKICASMGFSIESFEILRSYIQDFDDLEPMDLFLLLPVLMKLSLITIEV